MRILFIENRYATLLWREAATALEKKGHEIFWLVQNHLFAPKHKNIHIIPYPGKDSCRDESLSPELAAIALADRGERYFNITTGHYRYYRSEIETFIDNVLPDLVFGESTQFHELMTIMICKERCIPYLAPNATRFPAGRLVFFKYDSFDAVGGSGMMLSREDALDLIQRINTRSVVPSYMKPPDRTWQSKLMRLYEQGRIAFGWFSGERYVTPSPLRRIALDREHARAVKDWDDLSSRRILPNPSVFKRWVLFPLQLQPESNIDVYGQPWIDQAETMVRAATALGKIDATLVVKPNPKSKYEMNSEIVAAAKEQKNIIPLPHSSLMAQVFPDAPIVLSVTGTVILECIFSGKPVAVLGENGLANLKGVCPISKPEDISGLLEDALAEKINKVTSDDAIATIQSLHKTSYDALFWDPIAQPNLLKSEYVGKLQSAFCDVIKHLDEFR